MPDNTSADLRKIATVLRELKDTQPLASKGNTENTMLKLAFALRGFNALAQMLNAQLDEVNHG